MRELDAALFCFACVWGFVVWVKFRINWAVFGAIAAPIGVSIIWGCINLYFIGQINSVETHNRELGHYIHVALHLCLLAVMIWLELALAALIVRWSIPPEFAISLNGRRWLWWLCGPIAVSFAVLISVATVRHAECIWNHAPGCQNRQIRYIVGSLPSLECDAIHVMLAVLGLLLVVRSYTWVFHSIHPPTKAIASSA